MKLKGTDQLRSLMKRLSQLLSCIVLQWVCCIYLATVAVAEIKIFPAIISISTEASSNNQQITALSSKSNQQSNDLYPFDSPEKRDLFVFLISQLRCLVCQNENLADSNASLAKDLRAQIYRLVQQGADANLIKNYLVARYGDFILFKPPLKASTYILWIGPFLLVIIALLMLMFIIRRKRNGAPIIFTTIEQQRLRDIIG